MLKKQEKIILFIAFLFFLLFSFITQIYPTYLDPKAQSNDSISYIGAAYNFYHHFKADPMRPLLYPLIMGIPVIFDAGYRTILVWNISINAIAWIFTALLIFKILYRYVGRNISALFSIIFIIFCVGNFEFIHLMLSETLYTFLLVCIVYFVAEYLPAKKPAFLGWAFVMFCASLLVRPTLIILFPIMLGALAYLGIKKRKLWSAAVVKRYSILILSGACLIFFQYGMMKKDTGVFTISLNGPKTAYEYLDAYSVSLKNNLNLHDEHNRRCKNMVALINDHQWKALDSLGNADMKEQLIHNTKFLFRALKIDISANILTPGEFDFSNIHNWPFFNFVTTLCIQLSYWQNVWLTIFILVSIVFVFLIKYKISSHAAILILLSWVLCFSIILISGITFWQLNRFTVVCTPLALISLALLIHALLKLLPAGYSAKSSSAPQI